MKYVLVKHAHFKEKHNEVCVSETDISKGKKRAIDKEICSKALSARSIVVLKESMVFWKNSSINIMMCFQ